MIRKTIVFTLILSLFLILLSPGLVQAQSGLKVLHSSAEAEFPSKLHFNLSARSDVNITDVRLRYIVDQESYAQVTSEVYVEFVPDTAIDVQWAWDMRKTGGLPTGSGVEYWWTVEDAKGDRTSTTPVRVRFDDNRYSWQSLTEGKVTVYWYEEKQSFAEEIMLAAQQALARLSEDTGAYLKRPVQIYIYANNQDLLGAMIYPQEWTGGVNFFTYGIIAIGIAPTALEWGRRAIAHELTHQVTYQVTTNPYNVIPTWLNEGLAMYAEGPLQPFFEGYLSLATAKNNLISVRSLSSPFSAYGDEAYLSYAQSYSLVEFLINSYGQDKMLELLNTFSQGSSYDDALEKVYGFDMDGLDTSWQDYITGQYPEAEVPTEVLPPAQPTEGKGMHPALVVTLAALATAILLLLSLFAESWAWRRGW